MSHDRLHQQDHLGETEKSAPAVPNQPQAPQTSEKVHVADTPKCDVEYWDCSDDCEMLSFTEISEAVAQWADDLHPDPLPETVTVYGFASLVLPPSERIAEHLLDDALEWLDENYGDPSDSSERTAGMRAAAVVFADALRAEYSVWRCDLVAQQVVRVADHVPAEWMLTGRAPAIAVESSRSLPNAPTEAKP